jgi:hypothetical protein
MLSMTARPGSTRTDVRVTQSREIPIPFAYGAIILNVTALGGDNTPTTVHNRDGMELDHLVGVALNKVTTASRKINRAILSLEKQTEYTNVQYVVSKKFGNDKRELVVSLTFNVAVKLSTVTLSAIGDEAMRAIEPTMHAILDPESVFEYMTPSVGTEFVSFAFTLMAELGADTPSLIVVDIP